MLDILVPLYNNLSVVNKIILIKSEYFLPNINFIISDDSCAIENDVDILNKIKKLNIEYHKHINTGNPIDNWNFVIKKSKSEFIQLLHHDEFYNNINDLLWLNNNLHALSDINILDVYKQKNNYFIKHTSRILINIIFNMKNFNYLYFRNLIGSPSALIIKANSELKYNIKLKWLVDVYFYNQLFSNKHLNYTFLGIRINSFAYQNSISRSIDIETVRNYEIDFIGVKYKLIYFFYDFILAISVFYCNIKHYLLSIFNKNSIGIK